MELRLRVGEHALEHEERRRRAESRGLADRLRAVDVVPGSGYDAVIQQMADTVEAWVDEKGWGFGCAADMLTILPGVVTAHLGIPYSLQMFVACTRMAEFISHKAVGLSDEQSDSLRDSDGKEMVESLAHSFFFQSAWERAGRNSYEIEHDLAEMLLPQRTELRGLRGEDLRLPYPAIYLVIPPGLLEVPEVDTRGDVVGGNVWGMTIVEEPHYLPGGTGSIPGLSDHTNDNCVRIYKEGILGRSVRAWHISMNMDEGQRSFRAMLYPQEDVAEMVARAFSEEKEVDAEGRMLARAERDAFLFAMNAVIYATNVDGAERLGLPLETEELISQKRSAKRDRRRKVERRLADAGKGERRILGLLETDRTVPDVSSEEGEPCTGNVLTVRTLIPGHWKRQVCGPRNTERKLIFIRPYWRGPEGAPWGQHSRRVLRAKGLEKELSGG